MKVLFLGLCRRVSSCSLPVLFFVPCGWCWATPIPSAPYAPLVLVVGAVARPISGRLLCALPFALARRALGSRSSLGTAHSPLVGFFVQGTQPWGCPWDTSNPKGTITMAQGQPKRLLVALDAP